MQTEESSVEPVAPVAEKPTEAETPAKPARTRLGVFKKLKGKNKFDTMENYSIAGVVVGALMFTAGIGMTAINTQGVSVVIVMIGALVSFLSSVALILSWLFKSMFAD